MCSRRFILPRRPLAPGWAPGARGVAASLPHPLSPPSPPLEGGRAGAAAGPAGPSGPAGPASGDLLFNFFGSISLLGYCRQKDKCGHYAACYIECAGASKVNTAIISMDLSAELNLPESSGMSSSLAAIYICG